MFGLACIVHKINDQDSLEVTNLLSFLVIPALFISSFCFRFYLRRKNSFMGSKIS